VKFMFATTEPEKVLPTILSRCQRFDLRRIPVALIVQHLGQIAKLEKVQIDDAALHAIARGADGGMRDAESALDQLISFCGTAIVEEDVLSMFGLTAQRQILALSRSLLTGQSETALRELNELTKHGKDLSRLLADLLYHLRNLLIFQVSKGDVKLLEVSETEAAGLKEESALIATDGLTRIMEVLTESESRLREAASKKIFIEVALLKAIQARNAVSIDTVIGYLQQMRSGGASQQPSPAAKAEDRSAVKSSPQAAPTIHEQGVPSVRPPAQPAKAQPAPAVPEVASENQPDDSYADASAQTTAPTSDLETLWTNLLEAVGRASAFTRSYLLQAHPVSFAKSVLIIGFDPEFADQLDLVNNAKTQTLLQTKLKELGHPNASVRFVKAEAPGPRPTAPAESAASAPAAAAPSRSTAPAQPTPPAPRRDKPSAQSAPSAEDFKNDPLIQKALEIFKGQIVEVRP
jgi:DNA polymerase-3 subunit gamma/tau